MRKKDWRAVDVEWPQEIVVSIEQATRSQVTAYVDRASLVRCSTST